MNNVVVLGGTAAHIALIEALHRRGFYVVLVDYLSNPPAKEYADSHIQESTLDKEAVLRVAKQFNAMLVISSSVDQANVVACYVNEKLGLTTPYSYATAVKIANKAQMKRAMMECHVPTTKYVVLENEDDFTSRIDLLKYPLIVKPVDSCAASGVKKTSNISELKEAVRNAKKISRSGQVIVEEFFEGVEVSSYCFIEGGKAHLLMTSERLSVNDGDGNVLKCYATITPPNISKIAQEKIRTAASLIARFFGIDNSPFHIQALVSGDEIDIIEFAPRVGGGVSYKTIIMNSGFDIIDATINSYLNVPVSVPPITNKFYYAVSIIYANPGVYDKTVIDSSLFDDGFIESIHFHKTKGMMVTGEKASGGRIAAFITKGNNREDIIKKIDFVYKNIDVLDNNGHSILRRDLRITY